MNATRSKIIIALHHHIGDLELLPGLNININEQQWKVASQHPLVKEMYIATKSIFTYEDGKGKELEIGEDLVVDVGDQPYLVSEGGKGKKKGKP